MKVLIKKTLTVGIILTFLALVCYSNQSSPKDKPVICLQTSSSSESNMNLELKAESTNPVILSNHSARLYGPLPAPDSFINDVKPIIGAYYEPVVPGEVIDLQSASLFLDGLFQSSAQVSSTGIVMQPTSPLSTGRHMVIASVAIYQGNTSYLVWNFTIDLTLPKLVVNSPGPNLTYTNQANYLISGLTNDTGDVNVTINAVKILVDPSGYFSKTLHLANNSFNGVNDIKITATSKAGNVNYVNKTIIMDDVAPDFKILSLNVSNSMNNIGYVNTPFVSISGNINISLEYNSTWDIRNSKITVENWGNVSKLQANSNGNFNGLAYLLNGLNVLDFQAVDDAKNVRDITKSVIYDNEPPAITIISPDSSTSDQYMLSGKVTDLWGMYRVLVNGKETPLDNTGTFNFSVKLTNSNGDNVILINAFDLAGNSKQLVFKVYYDTGLVPNLLIGGISIAIIAFICVLVIRSKKKSKK